MLYINILIENHILIFILIAGIFGYLLGGGLHSLTTCFLKKIELHYLQTNTISLVTKKNIYNKTERNYKLLYQILACVLFAFIAFRFHCSWKITSYLILVSGLIVLSAIDINCYLLPDCITLPLMWLGLLVNTYNVFVPSSAAIFGCVFGYLSLRGIGFSFKLFRGVEGLGRGDCKLLATLGAWYGIHALPLLLLIASLSGIITGVIIYTCNKKHTYSTPLPFGPFLSLGGLIVLFL